VGDGLVDAANTPAKEDVVAFRVAGVGMRFRISMSEKEMGVTHCSDVSSRRLSELPRSVSHRAVGVLTLKNLFLII
jgi:hypothetical protein